MFYVRSIFESMRSEPKANALGLFPNDRRMQPGRLGAVVVVDEVTRRTRVVDMAWGLKPREPGRPWSLIRSEGRRFDARRCIVLLDEFYINSREGPNAGRWRVTPVRPHAGFAGIWRPAEAGWPVAYAMLTVAAGTDLIPYEPRQNVILWQEHWGDWLLARKSEVAILKPPPPRSLVVNAVRTRPAGNSHKELVRTTAPSLFDWPG
jgi:putative SOS response-associated peptidase YedK